MKRFKQLLTGLLLLFIFVSLFRNVVNHQKTLQFYESYKKDYDKEKQKNVNLKTQILKNTDPYEMERVMRDKLNMAQEDEVIVIVPNPTPTPVVITPTPQPVYLDWLKIFFNR